MPPLWHFVCFKTQCFLLTCELVKAWIDGFTRFVSVYVIIVFICLFNCVDLNMQSKIEMVFISCTARIHSFS